MMQCFKFLFHSMNKFIGTIDIDSFSFLRMKCKTQILFVLMYENMVNALTETFPSLLQSLRTFVLAQNARMLQI